LLNRYELSDTALGDAQLSDWDWSNISFQNYQGCFGMLNIYSEGKTKIVTFVYLATLKAGDKHKLVINQSRVLDLSKVIHT
jgi:hypothetical protein